MSGNVFGFTVREIAKGAFPPQWAVGLPHQCDTWDIAGAGVCTNWAGSVGVPHNEALAELDRFIAEAQQARAALAHRHPFGPGDPLGDDE